MPDPSDAQPYVQLQFDFDANFRVTKLSLKGPKAPVVGVQPTIAFKLKDGKYVFQIGGGDFTFAPNELSKELKALLGGSDSKGRTGPVPVVMPEREQLRWTDGSYLKFIDYELQVRMRAVSVALGEKTYQTLWPQLPKPLYEALIEFYKSLDAAPAGK